MIASNLCNIQSLQLDIWQKSRKRVSLALKPINHSEKLWKYIWKIVAKIDFTLFIIFLKLRDHFKTVIALFWYLTKTQATCVICSKSCRPLRIFIEIHSDDSSVNVCLKNHRFTEFMWLLQSCNLQSPQFNIWQKFRRCFREALNMHWKNNSEKVVLKNDGFIMVIVLLQICDLQSPQFDVRKKSR